VVVGKSDDCDVRALLMLGFMLLAATAPTPTTPVIIVESSGRRMESSHRPGLLIPLLPDSRLSGVVTIKMVMKGILQP